ncbi:TPA: hypothetical protein ACPYU1_000912 [Raoultella planticola]
MKLFRRHITVSLLILVALFYAWYTASVAKKCAYINTAHITINQFSDVLGNLGVRVSGENERQVTDVPDECPAQVVYMNNVASAAYSK